MKLSIIIPVYNEEKTVGILINKVLQISLPPKIKKEIIIIDDGSDDDTQNIIQRFKNQKTKIIIHGKNKGKGAAVRTGIKYATGEVLVIQDADLEYDPSQYEKLLKPILNGYASIVYGTRLKKSKLKLWGKNKTPLPTHWLANKFLTFILNIFYKGNLSDMETCYKMFKREVLDGMILKSDKFDIEPEITLKFLKKGHSIHEVPIKVKPRTFKEGKKINWKDGVVAVWTIIKYKFTD